MKGIEYLKEEELLLLPQPARATAFEGRSIAWFYSKGVGVVEVRDEKP